MSTGTVKYTTPRQLVGSKTTEMRPPIAVTRGYSPPDSWIGSLRFSGACGVGQRWRKSDTLKTPLRGHAAREVHGFQPFPSPHTSTRHNSFRQSPPGFFMTIPLHKPCHDINRSAYHLCDAMLAAEYLPWTMPYPHIPRHDRNASANCPQVAQRPAQSHTDEGCLSGVVRSTTAQRHSTTSSKSRHDINRSADRLCDATWPVT